MFQIKSARNLLTAALIATGALGAVTIPQVSSAAVVTIQVAPPPLRAERIPAARRGYVWVPGYWDWRGHRHVWVRGVYVKERRGYRYAPHQWVQRDGGWYMERGRWDRDGDGIPDNRDRRPNDPTRR
ncbi:MAG: YXWGXW repeat-containing protein [Betaproteobacteria bacterium]